MTPAKAKPNPSPVKPNGAARWLSRSFWIVLYGLTGSFITGYLLEAPTIITVVVPSAFTGWFGMKVMERYKNGRP